jgi:dolichol-phosphate mannosyltransferase
VLQLAIVIPTLNERDNIAPLLAKLQSCLTGIEWEVLFVDDDSSDGTLDQIRSFARVMPNVRLIHRIGRMGLGSACMEGMLATIAPYIAVMDADMQHDEKLLPQMLQRMQDEQLDIVVGSRHIAGGSVGEFSPVRKFISDSGKKLSRLVCRCELTDPMSGFFMADSRFVRGVIRRMSAISFKVLVDMLASSEAPVRIEELPYRFGERLSGSSKLDSNALVEYLMLVIDKQLGSYIPVRFLLFVLVGTAGLGVHLAILWLIYMHAGEGFATAQAIATVTAIGINFFINNAFTYRDCRLRGWRVIPGLLTFYLACSVGAVINFALASATYEKGMAWYISGLLGIGVGSIWNYGVTSIVTWRSAVRRREDKIRMIARSAAQSAMT